MIRRRFITVTMLIMLGCSTNAAFGDLSVSVTFTVGEVAAIHAYYGEQKFVKSKKDKGKKSLPPGIAKNLARGKPLPPGIAKQRLPADLIKALPAPKKGFERIIVDGRILLVEVATQIVHDVLEDLILS